MNRTAAGVIQRLLVLFNFDEPYRAIEKLTDDWYGHGQAGVLLRRSRVDYLQAAHEFVTRQTTQTRRNG
jgi:hypothetical protein